MNSSKCRVYCAGPLFNGKEREEMQEIAAALEGQGFGTFLPQRDGLELSKCVEFLLGKGFQREEAAQIMSEAIFALDVYQVLQGCDMLVANLNGRVPDEGTVAEAAMAWARGKPVVAYKADSRTAIGGFDNPLVTGLFEFRTCRTFSEVIIAVDHAAGLLRSGGIRVKRDKEILTQTRLGSEIWVTLRLERDFAKVVDLILSQKAKALV